MTEINSRDDFFSSLHYLLLDECKSFLSPGIRKLYITSASVLLCVPQVLDWTASHEEEQRVTITEYTDRPSDLIKWLLQQFHTAQAEVDISPRSGQRIGAFIARRAERQEQQLSRADLKRKLGDIFGELKISGPQIIANTEEPGRKRAILLLESEKDSMITALTELSKPRYATGSDLFRDLAHDGPASDLAQRLRKKVFQERRSFSDAISVKR